MHLFPRRTSLYNEQKATSLGLDTFGQPPDHLAYLPIKPDRPGYIDRRHLPVESWAAPLYCTLTNPSRIPYVHRNTGPGFS